MKLTPLGEVAEVIAGQSPEGSYYNSKGDGTPFYQGKKEFGEKFLGEPTTWTTKITKLAQPGDILMSVRAPVGPINFAVEEICIGRGLAAIRSSERIDRQYLFYFLLHKQPVISGNTGAVFDSINRNQIASIEVPLPSLDHQAKIVEKLDVAFSEIDLLESNLALNLKNVKELWLSLLSDTSGVHNFDSEIIIGQSRKRSDFKLMKLSEICDFSRGLTYSKSDEVEKSNNIVLRASNIDLNSNSLNLEDLRYIKDSIKIKSDKIVKKDSLIICTASGSKAHVGKVALIDQNYGYAFGGFMGQLSPLPECDPKFLFYILTSREFKDHLMNLNDGTNINNLRFSDIADYEILLPSLEDQREIANKLDSVSVEIERLQNKSAIQKDFASMLRHSLMNEAFSQEHELALS